MHNAVHTCDALESWHHQRQQYTNIMTVIATAVKSATAAAMRPSAINNVNDDDDKEAII